MCVCVCVFVCVCVCVCVCVPHRRSHGQHQTRHAELHLAMAQQAPEVRGTVVAGLRQAAEVRGAGVLQGVRGAGVLQGVRLHTCHCPASEA